MPLTIPSATIAITQGLMAAGDIGIAVPKLAKAISTGLDSHVHGIPVKTTDTGSIGTAQTSMPLTVPPPVLQTALTAGFKSEDILGIMAAATIFGLANGISKAFSEALVIANHGQVGSGTCVVSFGTVSAVTPMVNAFKGENMSGETSLKLARAIGKGLDLVFGALTLAGPIPGPPGPTGATGSAVGFIL